MPANGPSIDLDTVYRLPRAPESNLNNLSLRETKRRATMRAIELSAISLAAELGLENVTIEAISRRAQVSTRTFFNYFTSKEAALVGLMPTVPRETDIEEFVAGGPSGDLFDDLGELFARQSRVVLGDPEIHRLRRAALKKNPHLIGLQFGTIWAFEDEIMALATRRLHSASLDGASNAEPPRLSREDTLLVMLAIAALRYASRGWAAFVPEMSLEDRVRRCFADARTALTPH